LAAAGDPGTEDPGTGLAGAEGAGENTGEGDCGGLVATGGEEGLTGNVVGPGDADGGATLGGGAAVEQAANRERSAAPASAARREACVGEMLMVLPNAQMPVTVPRVPARTPPVGPAPASLACQYTRAVSTPRILLVGMMGSGKTTVGRLLAERLGVLFADNDDVLRQHSGGGPGAVFESAGEESLHDAEGALLRERLAASNAAEVVNVPASAVVEPDLRELLREAGSVIWLRARPQTLAARIGSAERLAGRPRYSEDMAEWLREKATERATLYAEVASHTLDVDDLPPWKVVQRILEVLRLGVFGWLPGSFSGVVLDLDGLLVDTEVIWMEGKRQLYADRGIPFSVEDHHAVLGTSEDYTAQVFARRFGLGEEHYDAVRDEYLSRVEKLFEGGIALRPGAQKLVHSLRGRVPLGLASNTRRRLVELVLNQTGLAGCFDAVVTAGEAPAKPDPGLYLEACRLLGIEPESSVAVEDSPTGARAALAAGMTTIGVPSDADIGMPRVHRIATSLTELIEPAD
jgi:HAD superfamily hydrolase (TIGR01509 family)